MYRYRFRESRRSEARPYGKYSRGGGLQDFDDNLLIQVQQWPRRVRFWVVEPLESHEAPFASGDIELRLPEVGPSAYVWLPPVPEDQDWSL